MRSFRFIPRQQTTRAVVAAPRRLRFLAVTIFFAVWTLLIAGRLVWLQVATHSRFVDMASHQQQRTFEVAPRRGVLYDRNLHELAMTVLVDSVYGVPTEMPDKAATARALARVVHSDPTDRFTTPGAIAARFNASHSFAWVARKLDPGTIARIKALNLKGVYFQKEFKRFYPNNSLSAQVLGYVGTDDNGLGGIERLHDKDLHGIPGHMLTAVDAKRHVLGSEEREPLPGDNLVLTIDENIQFMAERALDHAMAKFKALNGTIIIQDPYTGQVLGLAVRPTFDPNDFRRATTELLRNHAVSDIYEPGSTFKLVTYSAALDQKLTRPQELIDCQGGTIQLFGRTIHDAHLGAGVVTVEKALWDSSDVAAVKLALRLGPEKFYSYMRSYGFGARSGVGLPAETRGLLRPPARWGATSIGSLAIGQEVGVTPVQLVTMVSSIANGGTYLPPSVMLQRSDLTMTGKLKPAAFHPETEVPSTLPEGAHRVIGETTAAEMRTMMRGIVLNGSGKPAALNGYSAGGKTGTAQKIDVATHKYSKTKYVASFAGFAPVSRPAISVAVIIDSPVGAHYGTQVSAPVFAEVTQQVLEYLGVPHDQQLEPQKEQLDAKKMEGEMPAQPAGDLDALFAAVNELPSDDPLRAPEAQHQPVPAAQDGDTHGVSLAPTVASADVPPTPEYVPPPRKPEGPLQSKLRKIFEGRKGMAQPPGGQGERQLAEVVPPAGSGTAEGTAGSAASDGRPLVVDSQHRVAVPAFSGDSVRTAVERAGTAGLELQLLGSGVAKEQAPAPGTMVPLGTEIVVRFAR